MATLKLSPLLKEQQFKLEMRRLLTREDYQMFNEIFAPLHEEEISQDETEDLLIKVLQTAYKEEGESEEAPKDIDMDAMFKGDKEKAIQEVLLKEGAWIAIPAVVELLGRIIDWIYRKTSKKFSAEDAKAYKEAKKKYKQMKKDGSVSDKELHHFFEENLVQTSIGKYLKNIGHLLHKAFSIPIRVLVAGYWYLAPDQIKSTAEQDKGWKYWWNKARTTTDVLFAILTAAIAGYELFAHLGPEAVKGGAEVHKHALGIIDKLKLGAEATEVVVDAEVLGSAIAGLSNADLAMAAAR